MVNIDISNPVTVYGSLYQAKFTMNKQYGIFIDVRAVCDNILPIQNTCSLNH